MNQQKKADPFFSIPLVDEHPFTRASPLDYRPVFRSEAISNDFNAGLEHLRKIGRDRAIYQEHLKN